MLDLPTTILVVDDDAVARDLLARRLRPQGFEVVEADGARAALAVMGRRPIDLVLLDVEMPGISGIDTLRMLRHRFPLAELPILMVTSRRHTDEIAQLLALGASDHVPKPLDVPVLLARLRTHLVIHRTDAVTGAANARCCKLWLAHAFAGPRAAGVGIAVIDLDWFGLINDRHGHGHGDRVLRAAALRVAAAVGDAGCVGRLGGDELAIVTDIGEAGLRELVEAAHEALAAEVVVDGVLHALSATAGIAVAAAGDPPGDPLRAADALLGRAEAAMVRAKHARGGIGLAA